MPVHRADDGARAGDAQFRAHPIMHGAIAEIFRKEPMLDFLLLFGSDFVPKGVGT
jgi:hypothetical protein